MFFLKETYQNTNLNGVAKAGPDTEKRRFVSRFCLCVFEKGFVVYITDTRISDLIQRPPFRHLLGEAPPIGKPSRVMVGSAHVLGDDGNYHWQEIGETITDNPISLGNNGNGNGRSKSR